MNDLHGEFQKEVSDSVKKISTDPDFARISKEWMEQSIALRYCYNFSSFGRPIIQYPTDIIATQEVIWRTKPDLIINTGIAHGGSAILNASMLALLDYADAVENGLLLNPAESKRKVLAIDIDIRAHQKEAISKHPMSIKIDMLEGSSIETGMVNKVHEYAKGYSNVMVFLDSNHTAAHVLEELVNYAPLVSKNGYCIVCDGIIDNLPVNSHPDRPWGPGNSPKTGIKKYLNWLASEPQKSIDGELIIFEIDKFIEAKSTITAACDGFLKRL
jgi:cephalosporin hydroxylase